ncbi:MAG TPA: extracellular solute-binding protein [Candidatus Limnocylindria bacterium]
MFDTRRVIRTIALIASLSLVSAACGGASTQNTTPTSTVSATPVATKPPEFNEAAEQQKLYDAATGAGETEVNFYGSINEEESKPLIDIWNKTFPKIKMNYIRSDETSLVNRILTEESAGKHSFDVLSTTTGHMMKNAGLALQYNAPNAQLVDPDYKDKDGYWVGIYANWNIIQINTDKVKPGEIKSYEDLANPKWKGQIVIDDTDYEWYSGLVATRGQQQTDDMLKKIVQTAGVKVLNGHGNINDAITAGQYAIALDQYLNQPERSKRLGGPTAWVAVEPVIVQLGKIAVSKNAPHPNAAKLLENFLIGTDAQKYLTGRGRITVRMDVPNDPPNLVTGLKKWSAPAPLVDPELTKVAAQFKAIFK